MLSKHTECLELYKTNNHEASDVLATFYKETDLYSYMEKYKNRYGKSAAFPIIHACWFGQTKWIQQYPKLSLLFWMSPWLIKGKIRMRKVCPPSCESHMILRTSPILEIRVFIKEQSRFTIFLHAVWRACNKLVATTAESWQFLVNMKRILMMW